MTQTTRRRVARDALRDAKLILLLILATPLMLILLLASFTLGCYTLQVICELAS